VIDPVSATLGIGAMAARAGWMVVRGCERMHLRLSGASPFSLGAVLSYFANGKSLSACLGQGRAADGNTVCERCTYSRVRVISSIVAVRLGFSRTRDQDR